MRISFKYSIMERCSNKFLSQFFDSILRAGCRDQCLAKFKIFLLFSIFPNPKSLVVQQFLRKLVYKGLSRRYQVLFYLWRIKPLLKLLKMENTMKKAVVLIMVGIWHSFYPVHPEVLLGPVYQVQSAIYFNYLRKVSKI